MMATATTALVDFFFLTLSLLYLSDLCDKIRFWMCFIGELLRLKKLKHKVDQKKIWELQRRVPRRFIGILDFPCLRLEIWDLKQRLKQNRGEIRGWEYTREMRCHVPIGCTGLREILRRDDGLESSAVFWYKVIFTWDVQCFNLCFKLLRFFSYAPYCNSVALPQEKQIGNTLWSELQF